MMEISVPYTLLVAGLGFGVAWSWSFGTAPGLFGTAVAFIVLAIVVAVDNDNKKNRQNFSSRH